MSQPIETEQSSRPAATLEGSPVSTERGSGLYGFDLTTFGCDFSEDATAIDADRPD